MTPFEYLTVLISIILGMGITQIVTGVADLVHQWHRVKMYWPHLLWIIVIFFLHIQDWWATYELQYFGSLRLPTFLFVLLAPINLFILARLLFPATGDSEVDLKAFYFANCRKFFLWASFLPVLSLLNNVLVTGHPLRDQLIPIFLIAVMSILAIRRKTSERIHEALALLMLSAALGFLIVMWNDSLKLST
jgi:hypothetical protein